jgi:peptide chain release factor 2
MQANFWDDRESANKIIDEMNSLKEMVFLIESLKDNVSSDMEFSELLLTDYDEEMFNQLESDVNKLAKKLDKAEVYLLLSGPYDKNNCLLEIHSGAGGTEACDWADMLFRMYLRYLEKNNFKYEVLSYLDGDEVGLKSASIKVVGAYAYGYLKGEKGVHRLVRLSPFDANHKRHTSFASVDITPEFDNNIDIKIDEKDLKIDVYRASGAGGQHINRTESAVRITHLPTKIVVTCQNERSQIQNKETCMNVLKGKLKLLEIEKKEREMNNIKGENVITSFGSQIRSYVLHPYSMVKDHRTEYETSNVSKVLDGDIEDFISAYLKKK